MAYSQWQGGVGSRRGSCPEGLVNCFRIGSCGCWRCCRAVELPRWLKVTQSRSYPSPLDAQRCLSSLLFSFLFFSFLFLSFALTNKTHKTRLTFTLFFAIILYITSKLRPVHVQTRGGGVSGTLLTINWVHSVFCECFLAWHWSLTPENLSAIGPGT